MPKLTIQLDLSDEDAAPFAGRHVVVAIPATEAEYNDFLAHAARIQEGLRRMSTLIDDMRLSEKAMEMFFARHAATHVAAARTGETLQ